MFYWLVKLILTPILRTFFRPWVEGVENVPEEGPAILAGNHLSFSDHFFTPLVVPRKITYLAKSEYFTGTGLKGRLTAAFFRGTGQVPIDRSGGSAGQRALRTGLKVLEQGDLLGIYPEGTRSPDGNLYRGRTGIARLALDAKVPVIPVAMINTDKVQPPGSILPKRIMRVGIRFGKPLDFSRYQGMQGDRYVLRSITDEITYEVMKLSGQEYVDMYAAERKIERTAARRVQHAVEKKAKKEAKEARKDAEDPGAPDAAAQDAARPDPRKPGASGGADRRPA